MVAAVRGEKFIAVTEDLQREHHGIYALGEMIPEDEDGDVAHYHTLDEVQEWLGFAEYEDYAKALETEREKIFERGR